MKILQNFPRKLIIVEFIFVIKQCTERRITVSSIFILNSEHKKYKVE